MLKIISLAVLATLSVSVLKVDAHGTGQTIEIQSGQYMVDIGYDSIDANPLAGEPTRYSCFYDCL